ncbi:MULTISPECIES: phenylalanine--tRNA ligase subunit beta [Cellulophaga]|uniref:Phenylalanine--tRNA ligase beta subunit n=2 Tax=Cellulophaga TaxID=104264 RepID=F0R9Z1_CELLC|nr:MULTISPECIES: phenylalanine--tRNA ligase subunit beta [Cellulophaga]ADY30486.1 Phenylalanyl-tRNA synthetase beta chain [Cellulophaga lytica DSM 7489]APU11371.1 phenylalanine--tRNA ligase subunit beta [Cellulophaga lytica]EWH13993.1 phenylalanyl-tRNA ligase subunit beta [Cellulophaga geojensis KL-A]WQG78584.1 phenylalanine--tRNA ligase subunit beta [Cellulophaga lytica]SNQ43467.1 Phenylalanyl-tRNA synthetase beta chain [Cellulophaga lytica]
MKISYNWLKQFLHIDWEADKTAELLTDLGLEVEGISEFESVKGGLKGIVVGHVLTCVKHPNADKLKLTTVDIGADAPVQIVCGAPNVDKGQKVPVATIGTTLYTAEGEAWKIKKGKIRGEESHGMICAEDELGLGQSHEGIMVLADDLTPGTPCADIFEVELDTVFEIGLTPNRADAMSHFGVARDLRAGLIQQEIKKELITPPVTNFNVENRSLKVTVDVDNNELAPRYCGVTISNLEIKDSPDWLKNRLRSIGLTPKNNVVDATNYVLHELGQPLHAFDANKIKGHKIEVKTVAAGTKFTTLDDVERELHEEDLMICDEEKPLCIAGILGGKDSGVTENTTAIFLESAYFNPVSVRKTAKRHGLNTDASFRFERGIDIQNVEYALRRAASLIKEIAGGDITSDIVELYPKRVEDHEVFLTYEKINKLIGQNIPGETIKSILTSLDIKVKNVSESGMGLAIPFYRVDVQRQVDVIEEILRVYGYNNINFTTKLNASIATTSRFEDYKLQNVIGNQLASQGFYEIMANSLTTIDYNKHSENLKDSNSVAMLNPLSSDLSVLRQSMLFSGLEAISHNINRKKLNLKFFEFGKTYHNYLDKRIENKHLSLFLTGKQEDENWYATQNKSDFFYLKSCIETVFSKLGIRKTSSSPVENDVFQEGLSLKANKLAVVEFGVIKPSITADFDIKQEVLFADFNWDNIIKLAKQNTIVFKEISKYPSVKRDFALLLDTKVNFKDLYDIAFETEKKFLKEVNLFDVYTGDKLPKGKKSYAVSFTLSDDKDTLKDKQIDKIMSKLRNNYEKKLGAELR